MPTDEMTKQSVVKIIVSANIPDHLRPWSAPSSDKYSGSGVIINNNEILTNAHVIAYASHIEVKSPHSSKSYVAKVKTVGDDCDLALLTVDDPEFWANTTTAEFGEMPNVGDDVTIYGFPKGGIGLSLSKGIVSRIESGIYCHSSVCMLDTQVDAPINPGNSGGPAFNKKGQVMGIVHQGMPMGQNIGYIIPIPVVQHFLKDAKGPKYRGFPGLSFDYQNMENDSLREWAGMGPNDTGIMITVVTPALGSNNLKEGDIILKVDDFKVNNDATVNCGNGHLIDFKHIINQHYVGDTLTLLILRKGKQMSLNVKLDHAIGNNFLVAPYDFSAMPTFYINSGLAFTPLSKNYVSKIANEKGPQHIKNSLLSLLHSVKTNPSDQAVILAQVFTMDETRGYHQSDEQVLAVNGIRINNMQELADAFDNNKKSHHLVELQYGSLIVVPNFNPEQKAKLLAQIRATSDRSSDLKPQPVAVQGRIAQYRRPSSQAPLLFMAQRPGFLQQSTQEWQVFPYHQQPKA